MSNEEKEIVKSEQQELSLDVLNNPEVRKTFGKGANTTATDEEWLMFCGLAKATGLNPFLREIWIVPYVNSKQQRQTIIMTGVAGWRKIANSHPEFDGIDIEIENDPTNDKLPYKGTAKVYRKDRTRPTVATLYFREARRNDGDYGRWSTAPFQQFTKCLEVAALRMAFPCQLYVPEETGYDLKTGSFIDVTPEKPKTAIENLNAQIEKEKVAELYEYDLSELEGETLDAAVLYATKQNASIADGLVLSEKKLPRLEKYSVKNHEAK